jgi:hypothetical protein
MILSLVHHERARGPRGTELRARSFRQWATALTRHYRRRFPLWSAVAHRRDCRFLSGGIGISDRAVVVKSVSPEATPLLLRLSRWGSWLWARAG